MSYFLVVSKCSCASMCHYLIQDWSKLESPNHFKGDGLSFHNFSKKRVFRIFPWKERVCVYLCVWYHGKVLLLHSFFISMVYFLVSLSMLRKNMLAYRKGTPYCFMQQTTTLDRHGSRLWRFLMGSPAKNIWRGVRHVCFHKNNFVGWILFILFLLFPLFYLNKCSCFK